MNDKPAPPANRYDLPEWAGAFGDLGTLIPFVAAYVSILKMDANGLLVAFGLALIAVGSLYRTPFPVQPMKAIGAAAVSQATLAAGLGAAVVVGAALTTGLLWIALAVTGLGRSAASWVPRSALRPFRGPRNGSTCDLERRPRRGVRHPGAPRVAAGMAAHFVIPADHRRESAEEET